MAKLYISEYAKLATDYNGQPVPVAKEPAAAVQVVTFTTATASAAFNSRTEMVRLLSDTDCHLAFGSAPVATTSYALYKADTEYWVGVAAGDKVSAYDGVS